MHLCNNSRCKGAVRRLIKDGSAKLNKSILDEIILNVDDFGELNKIQLSAGKACNIKFNKMTVYFPIISESIRMPDSRVNNRSMFL